MKNLVMALVKAQGEFQPIKKDTVNPFFKSNYANLESVVEGTKQPLLNNGLCVIQTFGVVEGKSTLKTSLYHTSGEFIEGQQLIDVNSADPQKLASASTYARRYGLMAILGIAAEDDDGNTASQAKPKETAKPAAKPEDKEAFNKETDEQADLPQCIPAEELAVWSIGTTAPQVTGKVSHIEERQTKNKKDITNYTVGDLVIYVWGKKNPAIAVGMDVYFSSVAVTTYLDKKQYTAKFIDKEVDF
ncbi:MAG: ERF family protein [Sulfurimonas sp.]|jgi:hypothetical protein